MILDGDQERPSVQRLMPLSSTQNTKTEPLLIMDRRSESFKRRVIRGMMPWRAAMMRRRASVVVSTYPTKCWMFGLRDGEGPEDAMTLLWKES